MVDEKLKSSPPAPLAPSSANAARHTLKRKPSRGSGRSPRGSSTITVLFILAFGACGLQMMLYHPGYVDQLQTQNNHHWFNQGDWTLRNSTLNRNIIGADVTTDIKKDYMKEEIKELQAFNLTPDAFPRADIANDEHPILKLLRNAGIHDLTEDDKKNLPDWKALQSLYGNLEEPIVIGLETCATYRNTVPPPKRYAGVAGMFNTGTNAMEHHLLHNIKLDQVWQVPWGKHRMEYVRLNHTAPGMEQRDRLQVLPIVLIRDPYHWMHSMCKMSYAAHWKHRPVHCPNLVPDAGDKEKFGAELAGELNNSFPVKVIFDKEQIFYWKSLVHLWSDWYKLYFKATYPRLIFRFEDMVLHAPTIMKIIADCAGTTVPSTFKYQTSSSKSHGSGTTFLKVVEKTGDAAKRVERMTKEDLVYAREHLDEELMRVFQYVHPPIP